MTLRFVETRTLTSFRDPRLPTHGLALKSRARPCVGFVSQNAPLLRPRCRGQIGFEPQKRGNQLKLWEFNR